MKMGKAFIAFVLLFAVVGSASADCNVAELQVATVGVLLSCQRDLALMPQVFDYGKVLQPQTSVYYVYNNGETPPPTNSSGNATDESAVYSELVQSTRSHVNISCFDTGCGRASKQHLSPFSLTMGNLT